MRHSDDPLDRIAYKATRTAKRVAGKEYAAPQPDPAVKAAARARHVAGNAEAIETARIEQELATARAEWTAARANQPTTEADPQTQEAARQRAETLRAAAERALETRITDLQNSLTNAETQLAALKASDAPKQGDITRQTQQVALLRETLETMIEERGMTPEQILERRTAKALEKRIDKLERDLRSAENYLTVLQGNRNTGQRDVNKQQNKIMQLRKDLATAIEERDMTPEEIAARREAEIARLTEQRAALEKTLSEKRGLLQEQENAIAEAQAEERRIPTLKRELQIAEEAHARTLEKIRLESERLAEQAKRIEVLQAQLAQCPQEALARPEQAVLDQQRAEQRKAAHDTRTTIQQIASELYGVNRDLDSLAKQTRSQSCAAHHKGDTQLSEKEKLQAKRQDLNQKLEELTTRHRDAKAAGLPIASRLESEIAHLTKRMADVDKKLKRLDPSHTPHVAEPPAASQKPAAKQHRHRAPRASQSDAVANAAPAPAPAEPIAQAAEEPTPAAATAPIAAPTRPSLRSLIRDRTRQRPAAKVRPADVPASWLETERQLQAAAEAQAAQQRIIEAAAQEAAALAAKPPVPAAESPEMIAYIALCVEEEAAQKAATQAHNDFIANTLGVCEAGAIIGRANELAAKKEAAKKALGGKEPAVHIPAEKTATAELPATAPAAAPAPTPSHVAKVVARRTSAGRPRLTTEDTAIDTGTALDPEDEARRDAAWADHLRDGGFRGRY